MIEKIPLEDHKIRKNMSHQATTYLLNLQGSVHHSHNLIAISLLKQLSLQCQSLHWQGKSKKTIEFKATQFQEDTIDSLICVWYSISKGIDIIGAIHPLFTACKKINKTWQGLTHIPNTKIKRNKDKPPWCTISISPWAFCRRSYNIIHCTNCPYCLNFHRLSI